MSLCTAFFALALLVPSETSRLREDVAAPLAASAGAFALASSTVQRFESIVGREQLNPSHLRGELAESWMQRNIARDLRRTGNWQPVDIRTGPNGIDGYQLRLDSQGRVRDLMVAEAKSGRSELGVTRDGNRQMSSGWIAKRLRGDAVTLRSIARQTNFEVEVPTGGMRQRVSVPSGDGKALVFWRSSPRENWRFVGPASRLNEALRQADRTAGYLNAAADERVGFRRRLYSMDFEVGTLKVTVRDASRVGPNSTVKSLPVLRRYETKLTSAELQAILRSGREEIAKLLLRKNPGLANRDARRIASGIAKDPADFERLARGKPLRLHQRVPLAVKVGGVLTAVSLTVEHGELILEGRIPTLQEIGPTLGLGGASALAGWLTEQGINRSFGSAADRRWAQRMLPGKLANRTPIARMALSRSIGSASGGVVTAILFAYGGYLAGTHDLQTAHRLGVAGAGGVIVGLAASPLITAGLTTIALNFGTAGTGVAISSLSGAAATSAAGSWVAGSSLGGPAFLAVTVVATAAIGYSFDAWEAKQQTKRIRLTIDRLSKDYKVAD